jgi:hypothetical protein
MMTEKEIAELRRMGMKVNGVDWQAAYFKFLERGFTIASIGYWGTSFRTLNAPNEMELAVQDVRTAIDYYRDREGTEPALLISSLGNHLALGALGKDRLEAMNFLSMVPLMDGLQHHLRRVEKEIEEERQKAQANGKPFGHWIFFNIYSQTGDNRDFAHVQMLPLHDFIAPYVGAADYPWREVSPKSPCSRIVLGNKDPRTLDYLAAHENLPEAITVLASDHDLHADAPNEMSGILEWYGDCLTAQRKTAMR